MEWSDIACIVFICVTMNHLGLIGKIEETTGEIPVLNCPKCSTFWVSWFYLLLTTHEIITSLAVSFLASYTAIWLELLEGYVDVLYLKLYEKVYTESRTDTLASDTDDGHSEGSVSQL